MDIRKSKKPVFITTAITPPFFISILLFSMILIVYWQCNDFLFLSYDDPGYVSENIRIQQGVTIENLKWAFSTIYFSNWHPLTWISHMLDAQMYGNDPGKHHFINVLLHGINTILLFTFLRKATSKFLPSVLVAALFATHPIHIQSVAWISERKDLLCGLFFFLTITSWHNFGKSGKQSSYLLAILFYMLGLMAKPMVVTLPFVLLLIDFWPLNRMALCTRKSNCDTPEQGHKNCLFLVYEKIPFFILSILSSIVTFYAQKTDGAMANLSDLGLVARLENSIVSYVLYLGKLLIPSNFSIIYPHPKSFSLQVVIFSALIISSISMLAIRQIKSKPYIIIGWTWFLGMMIPVIGIVQVGMQAMADRYAYLPFIGLYIIIAFSLYDLLPNKGKRMAYSIISLTTILALSAITYKELFHWKNGVRLFSRAVAITENNYLAHNNLGYELVQQYRFEEAETEFKKALQIKPDFEIAHVNLGLRLVEEGKIEEGIEHYRTAIKIRPSYAAAHNNLGNTLFRKGDLQGAATHYIAALKADPLLIETYNTLGAILASEDKPQQAMLMFTRALELKPDFQEARDNLNKLRFHSNSN